MSDRCVKRFIYYHYSFIHLKVRGKNKNGNSYNGKSNVDSDGQDMTPEKPIHKRKHVYRSKNSSIRINKDIRLVFSSTFKIIKIMFVPVPGSNSFILLTV